MRMALLLLASLWLTNCAVGECGEPTVVRVDSGSYPSQPDSDYGEPGARLAHAGPIERMEVDREAGFVRFHGTTEDGRPFVETFRITEVIH